MATFEQGLQGLEGMVETLRGERDRLAEQVDDVEHARLGICLGFPFLCRLDIGALQTRADSLLALISAIEDQIADLVRLQPVVERTRDAARLQALLTSTANIINVVTGTDIVDDFFFDVQRSVDDARRDFKRLVLDKLPSPGAIGFGAGAALVVIGAIALSRAV